jgi:hypothetical protein
VRLLVREQLLNFSRRGREQALQRRALAHEKVALLHEKPQLCVELLFRGIGAILPQQLNGLLSFSSDACASTLHAAQHTRLFRHSVAQIRRPVDRFGHLR